MELVEQLLAHPQSGAFLFIGGLILSIFGFIQIVRKGLALVLYLMLFAVGMFPVVYAFKGSDMDFLANARAQVSDISGLPMGLKDDVIKAWCNKLDEAGQ